MTEIMLRRPGLIGDELWPRCSICGRFLRQERNQEPDDFTFRCTNVHARKQAP